MEDEDELVWLNDLAEKTKVIKEFGTDRSFPKSDSLTKTLHYILSNAHDFAWFADKRFHVRKGGVTLPASGKQVTTWTMFTNDEADLWKNSIEYVNDAILFYSNSVGNYPYQNVCPQAWW